MERVDLNQIPKEPRARWSWIKHQLELRGYSMASLAREHGKTRQQPSAVQRKSYPKWERIIADKLGVDPWQLWPERYDTQAAYEAITENPVEHAG